MDEKFSFHIAVRLIRDNWKAVIGNYLTSLIGEIWFDLHDKHLLRIILFPLLVRFCLIYKIWALVLGLYLSDVIKGLLLVLGPFLIPFWACVLGLRLGLASWACAPIISNPINIYIYIYIYIF